MANSIVQTIREAEIDARSLSEFISKDASFTVTRRLAPTIHTLDYYLLVLNNVKEKGDLADAAIGDTLDKLEQLEPTVMQRVDDAITNVVLSSGFVTVDSFELGATITQRNQALRHAADGRLYRWAGDLPKAVPTNSTPTSSGGMGDNAWIEVSDITLRQDIRKGMTVEGSWAVDGSAMREPLSSSAGISLGSEKVRPMVTFIDDDGKLALLSKLRPLYDAKGVKPGISIPTGKIGQSLYMTWKDVRDLYDNGWEVLSHTVTERDLSSIPEGELEQELRDSRMAFESRGMKIESLVPPFGGVPAAAYPLIRKYYRSSFVSREGGVQPIPINNYRVHRKDAVSQSVADNPSLQELKEDVDLAIASNSWLVLTTHSAYAGLDETQIGVISDLIDYIRSQGVAIVTPSEGLNVHGNLIDTGVDTDGMNPDTFFKIDRNGEAWPLKTKFALGDSSSGLNNTSPLTDFEDNCITVLRLTGNPVGLPSGLGARRYGVLKTVKHTVANVTQGFQEFFPTAPGSQCFIRVWGVTESKWQPWVETTATNNPDIYGVISSIDGDSPITDFTSNRKTIIRTSSGDAGWPTGGVFTVETTHLQISSAESYGYQTAIDRANGTTYIRSWDRTASQWRVWEGIGVEATNVMQSNTFNASDPVQSYPENRQVGRASTAVTSGMPSGSAVGIVTTLYRRVAGAVLGYQTFIATDANRSYVRTWDRNKNVWRDWVETSLVETPPQA